MCYADYGKKNKNLLNNYKKDNNMNTKQVKQPLSLEDKQTRMLKAREAKATKLPIDLSKQMFLSLPQIQELYSTTRSDTLGLIECSDTPIKSISSGKKVKYLAVDIKNLMAKFQ
jgi:hypothetical protein